jgi:hypothetical protein
MSGITRKLFSLLLVARSPVTMRQLRRQFEAFPRSALAALLSTKTNAGHLIRTGERMNYAYELSPEMRARLESEGIEDVIGEVRGGRIRGGRNGRPEESSDPVALHPAWPTPNRSASLAPQIAAALPWLDEEEAPPSIGVRYRDALAPRPRDD